MDLNGKVALVTGAANGIGMATVQQLLKNGLKGVSMCDIDSKNGEDAALSFTKEYGKDRIIFIKTDVTKEKDLEEAFKKTKETFGTIDIVINNAGIIGEDRWEAEIEVNVKGVVRGTQLALEYMGKHKGGNGGAVVNIASVAGLGTKSACPVYDGTKFFVVGYSQSISFPLMAKRHGMRILCMCPGATDTPILTEILDTFEKLDVGREDLSSRFTTQQYFCRSLIHVSAQSSEAAMKCFFFVSLAVTMVLIALTAAEECSLICPMIYAPICASDGVITRTFSNTCEMNVYNCLNPRRPFRQVRTGVCEDENITVTV